MALAPTRAARRRRVLLALLLGCALTGLGGELALRWLLFGEGAAARRLGRPLRQAATWTRSADEDDYWKLLTLFEAERAQAAPGPDPVLGWTGALAASAPAHPDEDGLRGRRPVLLFGDSFAQCVTAPEDCWQGLLERSELGGDLALLNHGVGGYGLDQIVLLAERVVPRFAARDPVVVVAILVDDDLERCTLSIRGWPKPRFRLSAGGLELTAPGDASTRAWIAEHPPAIGSYVLRLLRRSCTAPAGFTPGWTDAHTLPERRALARALLERLRGALAAQGVRRWFVWLVHGELALADTPRARWQEELVAQDCREHGVACVSTRPYLEAALAHGATREDLFVSRATLAGGHYGESGNRVAFEALLQGLRGASEPDLTRVMEWARAGELRAPARSWLQFRVRGHEGLVRARGEAPCVRVLEPAGGPARLSVRAGDDGMTEVRISLAGARRLTARARAVAAPGAACAPAPPLSLLVRRAGGEWPRREFALGAPEAELVLDGLDGSALELRVERPGGDPACAWLVLDDVRLE
jgi:hypothetical protein